MYPEKPKRNGKPYQPVTRGISFWKLVVLFFAMTVGLNAAVEVFNWLKFAVIPDCGTRAGYQIAYISNSVLYLTDEATGQPHAIADVAHRIVDMRWSPNGQRIALTTDSDTRILSVDGAEIGNFALWLVVNVGPHRGRLWYWADDYDTIVAIAQGGEGNEGDWQLVRWQAGEAEATPLVMYQIRDFPQWSISPDRTQIAMVALYNGRTDLLLIDIRTGNIRTIYQDVQDTAAVEWSHDGRYVLLTNHDLYRITVADGTIMQMTQYMDVRYAHWSPDDRRIAFVNADGLFVMSADSNDALWLVDGLIQLDFVWSPNSEQLLFEFDTGGSAGFHSDLMTINRDGSGLMNLTQADHHPRRFGWSADGQYVWYKGIFESTYVVTMETGERFEVSPASRYDTVWSPDGRYAAVEIDNRLHLVEAATGERCIVHRNGSAYPYIWRPIPIDG